MAEEQIKVYEELSQHFSGQRDFLQHSRGRRRYGRWRLTTKRKLNPFEKFRVINWSLPQHWHFAAAPLSGCDGSFGACVRASRLIHSWYRLALSLETVVETIQCRGKVTGGKWLVRVYPQSTKVDIRHAQRMEQLVQD
jgi:hypothetical protein